MNILLTSVGRRSYLVDYFRSALGENGKIHVANSSNISPAFLVADKSVVTPLIYDESYIPFLIEYCKNNEIDVLISLFDIDLPILAKNKNKLKEVGVDVIVSDIEVVDICNDKWKTYQFLGQHGIKVPKTYLKLIDVKMALEKNEITYPLIIKPRWGMGSIAIYEADNEEELFVFYEKAKRNILNTYLKYESEENIEESVIVQEKMRGQEYGLDVINDLNKRYITTVVKKKYGMRSGETDCAVTVDNYQAKVLGEKLSGIMRHIANLDVDVFDVNGELHVLEMNARFGGGYPFSHMAGVNLPLAILEWSDKKKIDENILKENYNVMSQKDIRIVKLQ